MDKFTFGNYSTPSETVFSSTKGYSNPTSETETRNQLSKPLVELKTFINKIVPTKGVGAVILSITGDNHLQYKTDESATPVNVISYPYSFVGMVISGYGDSLNTEAKVKAIYGGSTSWTLMPQTTLKSAHVFGNGYALGLTSGNNDRYGLKWVNSQANPNRLIVSDTAYGKMIGSSAGQGTVTPLSQEVIGVITKQLIDSDPDENEYDVSGLEVDVDTNVYTWRRTA